MVSLGNKIVNESEQVIGEHIDNTAKNYINRVKVCQDHLSDIKKLALDFYDEFIDRENRLLIAFIKYKLSELELKYSNVQYYLH